MSKTVSGELITIDDSAYDGMDDIVIYGKTVQNLWVNPSGTKGGVTVTDNNNGSITISGTSGVARSIFTKKIFTLKPNRTVIAYTDRSVSEDRISEVSGAGFNIGYYEADGTWIMDYWFGIGDDLSLISQVPNNSAYSIIGLFVEPNTTVSGTYRVMLREATEAEIAAAASTPQTLPVYPDDSGPDASNDELGIMPLNDISTLSDAFDDYWCPPGLSSIDNVEIVTTGKNVVPKFDIADLDNTRKLQCTINKDGSVHIKGIIDVGYQWVTQKFIIDNLVDGETYTLYDGDRSDRSIYCQVTRTLKSDPNSSNYYSCASGKYTFTVNKSLYDYRFNIQSGDSSNIGKNVDIVLYPQIEAGSEATDYEQPFTEKVSIDLDGNSLCSHAFGISDELRIDREGNVTLIKRVGTITTTEKNTKQNGTSQSISISADIPNSVLTTYGTVINNRVPTSLNGWSTNYSWCVSGNSPNGVFAYIYGLEIDEMIDVLIGGKFLYRMSYDDVISLGKIDLPKLRKKPLVNNVFVNGSAATTNFYLDTEMELTYRQWPGVRADGFKVSGKHNFWDFSSCVASSDSGKPEKKFVTATVPYMSGFYDLSKIYGAIAYESRDVSYTFELLGDDMEDLQRQKTNLLDWLGLVHDEPIYDDTQPNYHYVGSFYEADWEEDETGESGTLTVTFKCQPFLIADRATEESLSVGTNTVVNPGQQVSVFAKANSGSATVKINGVTQAVTTTEQRLTAQLQPGDNEVVVTSNSVTLRYYESHL